MNFEERWVEFRDEKGVFQKLFCQRKSFKPQLLSTLQLSKVIQKRSMIFAVKIKDLEEDSREEEILRKHPILREYKDILPKELLSMPPRREFDFSIDLVPGAEPISRTPYRMTTIEMEELKVQLNELLVKESSVK